MLKFNSGEGNGATAVSSGLVADSDLSILQRKEDVDQFVADTWATATQKEANQLGSEISDYGGAIPKVLTATQSSAVVALLLHFGLPQVANAVQNPLVSEISNVLSTSVSVALTGVFVAGFVINAYRNRELRQGIENAQNEVQENVAVTKSTFGRITSFVENAAKYIYNNFIKVAK